NQTDYAYDANGNTIAVAEPLVTTSQGTMRPTTLYAHDGNFNVVAMCDATWAAQNGQTWSTRPVVQNALCGNPASAVTRLTYATPADEPYGELVSVQKPLGYRTYFSYNPAGQGGADFGLPTDLTGDAFPQTDGSTFAEHQTFAYDGAGEIIAYNRGDGAGSFTYDGDERLIRATDPDGVTSTRSYFLDGSVNATQSAVQAAAGVFAQFTYDADGNQTSESRHFGCVAGTTCVAGVTTKWYDGADRLIEVRVPDSDQTPAWLTRYFYDLTGGGTFTLPTGAAIRGAGNLVETQETISGNPLWTATKATAFDALDRETATYAYPPNGTTLSATTFSYDQTPTTRGFLQTRRDP
ncbi:MAG: hypothetical protein ACREM8_15130, partial [Vulcanimicrobiaceae bacterium]